MKKRVTITLLVLCLTVFCIGCESKKPYDDIYDSDEKIAMQDQFEAQKEEDSKLDNESYQYTADVFSGAKTIWQYNAKEGESIAFAYDLYVYKGKGKLVLVQPDQTIMKIAAANSRGDGNTISDNKITTVKGLYKLKVVGAESPKITITLKFSHGSWEAH